MPGPRNEAALVRLALSKELLNTSLMPRLSAGVRRGAAAAAGVRGVGAAAAAAGGGGGWGAQRRAPRTCDRLDLPAHLHAVLLGLNDVGPGHQEEGLRALELLEEGRLLRRAEAQGRNIINHGDHCCGCGNPPSPSQRSSEAHRHRGSLNQPSRVPWMPLVACVTGAMAG
jgi:hypothetical protein